MIKYAVYDPRTGKYYSGGYGCNSDLEMAKLYKRRSDAIYRRRAEGPYWSENKPNHLRVVDVKVTLEVIDVK